MARLVYGEIMNVFGLKVVKISVAATVAISPVLVADTPALASCTVSIRNTTYVDERYTDTAHEIRYEFYWKCDANGQQEMISRVSTSNAMIDRAGEATPGMSTWSNAGAGNGVGGLTSQLLPQTTYFVQGYVSMNGTIYSSEILAISTTSEEIAARNTTTTTTSAASNMVSPILPRTTSSEKTTTVTTVQTAIEDEGVEDDFAELSVRFTAERYDLRINSSYPETEMIIRARKPGARIIVWNLVTSVDGAYRILTTRNLSGYTLSLLVDDEVFHRVRVR